MSFDKDAENIAKKIMQQFDPNLSERFGVLIQFLADNPDSASGLRGNTGSVVGSEEYIHHQAENFVRSREPRAPTPPATIPDEMVSFIINKYFDVPENELERAVELHNLSMGAENLIGDILERYIASVAENYG